MPKMKPSGIEWIGDIPDNWETSKIKYVSKLNGRIGWQGLTSDEYTEEGPYLITGVDFVNGGIDWKNVVHVTIERWREAADIQIQNGDLLITKDGTVGKVAIVSRLDDKASLNSGVLLIKTRQEYSKKYLFWILQSDVFWTWFNLKNAGNSTIIHLYQNDFIEFKYIIPPYPEQQAIVSFLDARCKKIDGIITAMEQQIGVLKQYKTSLITETVTKGLDKSVPMKDSGIEWIGKIPAHWKTGRIKYAYITILGKMLQPVQEHSTDKEMDYMCSANVTWEGIDLSVLKQMWFSPSEIKQYLLKEGDLLVAEGGDVAVSCIWKEEVKNCCIQNALHLIRKNDANSNRFLYYWLYFLKHSGYVDLVCNKATIAHFTKEKFGQSPFCILPVTEQNAIADFLDDKCGSVNKVISDKQTSIETMKSYKKSLIYEYVTGKKRVKI
jgi:type I restriction enzyme S subunit